MTGGRRWSSLVPLCAALAACSVLIGCAWEQPLYFAGAAAAFPISSAEEEDEGTAGAASPGPAPVPFGVGEHLEFSVNYNVLNAGTATLSVAAVEQIDGHDCYRLVSTARSNSIVSTFFKVRDRVESFMDVGGLFSRKFEKHLREGSYEKDEIVHMDHCAGLAYYADGDTAEIMRWTQDALSSLYYVRTLDLEVGGLVAFPNHSGKKNYPLRVRVLGRERLKTRAGRFDCLVVEPRLKSEGIFKHEGRLTVWLTDDEMRMPVRMKTQIKIGSITADLTGWTRGERLDVARAAGRTAPCGGPAGAGGAEGGR